MILNAGDVVDVHQKAPIRLAFKKHSVTSSQANSIIQAKGSFVRKAATSNLSIKYARTAYKPDFVLCGLPRRWMTIHLKRLLPSAL